MEWFLICAAVYLVGYIVFLFLMVRSSKIMDDYDGR